jgi:hypothetical protein
MSTHSTVDAFDAVPENSKEPQQKDSGAGYFDAFNLRAEMEDVKIEGWLRLSRGVSKRTPWTWSHCGTETR